MVLRADQYKVYHCAYDYGCNHYVNNNREKYSNMSFTVRM
jgi:hypothetical protein